VLIDQGEYHDPRLLSADGLRVEHGYATDVITDLSLRWLENLGGDDPWCLLICHKAPHRPWEPNERHGDLYREPIPVPATFHDDYSTRSSSARRAVMRIAEYLTSEDLKRPPPEGLGYEELTLWKYQRFMEDYLRCVASIDDNVGRVIDWLRARHEFDDTVVIYSSDQGFFLGDHGWFDKRLMYEESLRMPFLVSCPSLLPAGRVFDGIVTNVDFAQSILDAAAVEQHPRMQGRSFWPDLLGTPTEPPAEGMYYRYWEHDDRWHRVPGHHGYRTDRYKLVYFYNDGLGLQGTSPVTYPPEWELYDLQNDPYELHNVYDEAPYRAVSKELEVAMWDLQQRLGDAPHASQERPSGR